MEQVKNMGSFTSWRDVIDLKVEKDGFEGNSSKDLGIYKNRITKFLDMLEVTPEGQEILSDIKDKYGDKKIDLNVINFFASKTYADIGQIVIDVRDEKFLAFINQNDKKPMNMPLERILMHELVHVSDKRMPQGMPENREGCFNRQVEEFAVKRTDDFAKKYIPSWGSRGAYDNIAGKKADEYLGVEGKNGVDILGKDSSLVQKIEQSIKILDKQLQCVPGKPVYDNVHPDEGNRPQIGDVNTHTPVQP